MNWVLINSLQPPENKVINYKIDDEKGCRNECQIIKKGNLYWLPDNSMYVYFTPTHWSY